MGNVTAGCKPRTPAQRLIATTSLRPIITDPAAPHRWDEQYANLADLGRLTEADTVLFRLLFHVEHGEPFDLSWLDPAVLDARDWVGAWDAVRAYAAAKVSA